VSTSAPGVGSRNTIGVTGMVQVDGESATLVFQRLLLHPIEEVWEAITDPKQIAVWYMAKVSRDSPRGTVEIRHTKDVHSTGRVLEWDPPRVYEYEWNVAPGPHLPHGERTIVRWELAPAEGGTLLVMTHRKLTRPTAETFAGGFAAFLDRLAAYLDGTTPLPEPAWMAQARRLDPSE
jgi:uncharacterized protein YndB with AHSA1/START domain